MVVDGAGNECTGSGLVVVGGKVSDEEEEDREQC